MTCQQPYSSSSDPPPDGGGEAAGTPEGDPRTALAGERTSFAKFRTALALDRTTLAWIRTALTLKRSAWAASKRPSASLTAPIMAMFFRVGACRTLGSRSSGGTHMAQRVPCCWKWHSSSNHTSTHPLWVNRRSLLKALWAEGSRLGDHGAGLSPPKPKPSKEPLALANTQRDTISDLKVVAQELAVPESLLVPESIGWLAEVASHPSNHGFVEERRTPWPGLLAKPRKPIRLKALDPALHGSGAMPKDLRHVITAHAIAQHQDTVQAVIVPRFFRPLNLILHCQPHHVSVSNRKPSHERIPPIRIIGGFLSMRNYI